MKYLSKSLIFFFFLTFALSGCASKEEALANSIADLQKALEQKDVQILKLEEKIQNSKNCK